jgi:hypothetical protein
MLMNQKPRQLRIPDSATQDPRARQILRVWAAFGKQHVTLDPSLWDDPGAWGLMLVDLARHVANAYEQSGRMDSATALDRLKQGFDAEWNWPTDKPTGQIIDA